MENRAKFFPVYQKPQSRSSHEAWGRDSVCMVFLGPQLLAASLGPTRMGERPQHCGRPNVFHADDSRSDLLGIVCS